MNASYRTLIRGRLKQLSALSVGGSQADAGGPDLQCARDGLGRLTIPGTSVAGCLIETAGRIFPRLLDGNTERDSFWHRITGKGRSSRNPNKNEDDDLKQSLWQFRPLHLAEKVSREPATEARQGVGIRQATGAAATEARALFDIETIPAGQSWELFLELDPLRAGADGAKVEAVALLALWEWTQERCWLGASAARGLGWMKLEDVEVLRLPVSREAIEAWPDNMLVWKGAFPHKLTELVPPYQGEEQLLNLAKELGQDLPPAEERFHYLTLEACIEVGKATDGYGWDTLSIGGHAAGMRDPLSTGLLAPQGLQVAFPRDDYIPDAPVVATNAGKIQPLLPGSSVRGPLRHAASRWRRSHVPDARVTDVHDPKRPERKPDDTFDALEELFGLTEHSGHLLIRDGRLDDLFRLAWLQHHAEDEFTGGVYGSGKFDRTAVVEGSFTISLVLEVSPYDHRGLPPERKGKPLLKSPETVLVRLLDVLKPALRLAELGLVPLGGGKWRGHGWLPWRFTRASYGRAGEVASDLSPKPGESILDALRSIKPAKEATP